MLFYSLPCRMPTMKCKNDFVIWLFLSDTQIKIYQDFLELESVKEVCDCLPENTVST